MDSTVALLTLGDKRVLPDAKAQLINALLDSCRCRGCWRKRFLNRALRALKYVARGLRSYVLNRGVHYRYRLSLKRLFEEAQPPNTASFEMAIYWLSRCGIIEVLYRGEIPPRGAMKELWKRFDWSGSRCDTAERMLFYLLTTGDRELRALRRKIWYSHIEVRLYLAPLARLDTRNVRLVYTVSTNG